MFIDESVFKRLINRSYKKFTLYVAQTEAEDLIILANGFKMQVQRTKISKKALGAIVEIIGELPEKGKAYRYEKDVPREETGMDLSSMWEKAYSTDVRAYESNIIMKSPLGDMRIMQCGQKKEIVYDEALSMINTKKCTDSEAAPKEPVADRDYVYWHNEEMVVGIKIKSVKYIGEKNFIEAIDRLVATWSTTTDDLL